VLRLGSDCYRFCRSCSSLVGAAHHKSRSRPAPTDKSVCPNVKKDRITYRARFTAPARRGNGILRGRDSGVEKPRHVQPIVSRDEAPARKPTNSALVDLHREISVCMGLCGGAGRRVTPKCYQ
jgi:hypothetical protein